MCLLWLAPIYWCDVWLMKEHYVRIATKFLEEEIICIVGVPIYHENNWGESLAKFDVLCKNSLIHYIVMAS